MQSNDPILALLGLFILSTTFFFCGKEVVTSPPPAALESRTTIPSPAPKISEPPPSSSSAPPVSAPMGLNGRSDERPIGQTIAYQIAGAPLRFDGKMLANTVAAILHEVSTVDVNVSRHRSNGGFRHGHEGLSEPRAHTEVEDFFSQGIAIEQLTSNGFRVPRLVAARPPDEGRWQNRKFEWSVEAEREQP